MKNRTITIMLITLTWVIAVQAQNRQEVVRHFKIQENQSNVQVKWNPRARFPEEMTGLRYVVRTFQRVQPDTADIHEINMDFILKNQEILRIPIEALRKRKIYKLQDRWYAIYQTYYRNIPIMQGKVGFTLSSSGAILTYASNFNPIMEIGIDPTITRRRAIAIAREHHRPELDIPTEPRKVTLMIQQDKKPDQSFAYRLIWRVFIATKAGNEEVDRVFLIDARTGEMIMDFHPNPSDVTGTIQGQTYQEHSTDPITTQPFEHETVSVPGHTDDSDATGSYVLAPGAGAYTLTAKLEGPFARVQTYNSGTATDEDIEHTHAVTDPGAYNFTWTPALASPDDGDGVNVFWHANRLHDDYYQAILGINWNNAWTGTTCVNYSVNRGAANNAYAGNPIKLYSDATSRNCDIVYHESSHNILNDMFGGSYIGWPAAFSEAYAFDEGFADYVACSFNNDPTYAENVHATRSCDNTMLYPGTTYATEGHTGGQLISGVAWDLWNKQGLVHNATDVLLFAGLAQMATQASPYYFSNPNHSNYFTALLTADDNNGNLTDGTPHDKEIFQAFRNHDLLPIDVFCKDNPADDGNVPYTGQSWKSPDVWVRNAMDGGTTHQNPIYTHTNYIYIRVRNLGYLQADTTTAKVYWADPAGGIPWPADWNYIGETTVTNIAANSDLIAVPVAWAPSGTVIGHRCLLVRLECKQDIITEEGEVKQDNNITMKNVTIISIPSGPPSEAVDVSFYLLNEPNHNIDLRIETVELNDDNQPIPLDANPFQLSLDIEQLMNFQKIDGGKTESVKVGGGFLSCGPRYKQRFILHKAKMKIVGLQMQQKERALTHLEIKPMQEMIAGKQYEINVEQYVDGEMIGGLTYLIQVKED